MRTADATAAALGAIVGICAALIICVIALIVFVIVFCNLKIKNDTNIRKRLLAKEAFDEEKSIEETQSVHVFVFLNIETIIILLRFNYRLVVKVKLQENTIE